MNQGVAQIRGKQIAHICNKKQGPQAGLSPASSRRQPSKSRKLGGPMTEEVYPCVLLHGAV